VLHLIANAGDAAVNATNWAADEYVHASELLDRIVHTAPEDLGKEDIVDLAEVASVALAPSAPAVAGRALTLLRQFVATIVSSGGKIGLGLVTGLAGGIAAGFGKGEGGEASSSVDLPGLPGGNDDNQDDQTSSNYDPTKGFDANGSDTTEDPGVEPLVDTPSPKDPRRSGTGSVSRSSAELDPCVARAFSGEATLEEVLQCLERIIANGT
jgi:hypothetical protein